MFVEANPTSENVRTGARKASERKISFGHALAVTPKIPFFSCEIDQTKIVLALPITPLQARSLQ